MPYIIENAHILKGKQLQKNSLLINKNRIIQTRMSFRYFQHMKMDANSFIMTRPHVIYDADIAALSSSKQRSDYFIHSFILKGSTIMLTSISIQYESDLLNQLNTIRKKLIDCPIDYVIAVKIPVKLLTTSFIRKCKREKISVILVEVNEVNELSQIPWGWIREAMFPYFPPLLPIFNHNNRSDQELWLQMMNKENIPTMIEQLDNGALLSENLIKKIGIYPLKGNLFSGGEVSYNFYLKPASLGNVDESELFHYYNDKLVITVHKGIVIRAGKDYIYRSDLGEELKITTPSFFVAT